MRWLIRSAVITSSLHDFEGGTWPWFVEAMRACVAAMPYAQSLSAAGVAEADLTMLAEDALKVQRLLVNNPRELGLADALAIYRAAY